MTITLNLQMKALRKSYLRRSHGDALVEERTNPSCSLTSAFSVGISLLADIRESSADRPYTPAHNTCPLCCLPAPVAENTFALYFKDPQTRTRAMLSSLEISPYKGAEKAMLKGFGK